MLIRKVLVGGRVVFHLRKNLHTLMGMLKLLWIKTFSFEITVVSPLWGCLVAEKYLQQFELHDCKINIICPYVQYIEH